METPTTIALDYVEHAASALGQRAMGGCAVMLNGLDLTIPRRRHD
jgi:hypothetical protein